MLQLNIVYEVPLSLVRKAPSLSFIIQYRSKPEVLRNWFLPVCVRVGWPGNGHYLTLGA
jgi:hypothetical protein